jgi:hypothetical protein
LCIAVAAPLQLRPESPTPDPRVAAYTIAQTTKQAKTDFGLSEALPLYLAPGESLYACIGVSNTGIVFRAEGGAYV